MDPNWKNPALAKQPKTLICYICGRQYGTKSLAIHIKSCKTKWLIQQEQLPKKERRVLPKTPRGLYELLEKPNISHEDIEAYNRGANDKFNYEALVRCEFCNRTFYEDRMANHRKICTKEKPFKPLPANTKNVDDQTVGQKSNQFSEENMYAESQNLVECQYCSRKFAPDRISKHESICQKSSQKKAPTSSTNSSMGKSMVSSSKKQPEQTKLTSLQNARDQKKSNFSQSEKEVLENKSCVPQFGSHQKSGNKFEEAKGNNNDLVQCPYCDRKFNQQAAERHIQICQNVQHRPKKVEPTKQNLQQSSVTSNQQSKTKPDGKVLKTYKKSNQEGYKFNF